MKYSTEEGIIKTWGPRWLFGDKDNRILPKAELRRNWPRNRTTGLGLCQEAGGGPELFSYPGNGLLPSVVWAHIIVLVV